MITFSHQPESYFVCPEWDSAECIVGVGKVTDN